MHEVLKKLYKLHILSILLIGMYTIPLFMLGENIHIPIHDIFDDFNFVAYEFLKADPSYLFANGDKVIPSYFGGLLRDLYPSELSVFTLIHVFFPIHIAYAINEILMRYIAYFCMFYLLTFGNNEARSVSHIAMLVSVAYALLPFWPSFGISVSGAPMVVLAFIKLSNASGRFIPYTLLFVYPLYSSFIFGGMFVILIGLFFLLSDFAHGAKQFKKIFLGILLLIFTSIIVNYRLFRIEFFTDFMSHRELWNIPSNDFLSSLVLFLRLIMTGHYHAATSHFPVVVVVITIYFAHANMKFPKIARLLLLLIILTCFFAAFYNFTPVQFLKYKFAPFLQKIQLDRIYFLLPLLVYWLFYVSSLAILDRRPNWSKFVMLGLLAQICINFSSHPELRALGAHVPTVKQYIEKDLFDEIALDIGEPKSNYRVASFGLHPNIPALNGFYTIDGYANMYPASYKQKFGKLIEIELKKSDQLSEYFYNWGSRAYLFSRELGRNYVFSKLEDLEAVDINFDPMVFNELGGRYIISGVPIKAGKSALKLVGKYESKDSYWRLFVYAVNSVD